MQILIWTCIFCRPGQKALLIRISMHNMLVAPNASMIGQAEAIALAAVPIRPEEVPVEIGPRELGVLPQPELITANRGQGRVAEAPAVGGIIAARPIAVRYLHQLHCRN